MPSAAFGVARIRAPERTRTLVVKADVVWIWPGIPLTARHGATIVPVNTEAIRFWITRLHGPESLDKDILSGVSRAARRLTLSDEIGAQRALDALQLTELSRDGASLMRAIADHLGVDALDLPLRAGPRTWTARDIALHLPLFQQHVEAARFLAKVAPWDSSKHPRWPAGAPDSQGGRFAPQGDSGSWVAPLNSPAGSGQPPTELPQIEVPAKPPPGIGHNQGPPLDEPPDVPQPPLSDSARNAFIKLTVRWILQCLEDGLAPEIEGYLLLLQSSAWIVEQCYPYIAAYFTPPKTLQELQQDALTPAKGYDVHHFAERSQSAADGIPESVWNGPENKVRVPTLKHWQITGWYMTKNPAYDWLSPRTYLRGRSWDEKIRVGRDALIRFGVLRP